MRRLPLLTDGDAAEAGRAAADVVARGGVVLLPTETFYGLGADPMRPDAVQRVYHLKGRPAGLPLPLLCADWEQVERLAEVPEAHRVRLGRIWPGPMTVVLRSVRQLPVSDGPTVAVRIPGHARLRAVLYRTGPLTGTSANRHGLPPSVEVGPALASLAGHPDLVLDGGTTEGGQPTTVVDLSGAEPRVVRAGALPWDEPYLWHE